MGLTTLNFEYTSSIPHAMAVEALVQACNLSPEEVPQVITRILEERTSSEGSQYKIEKISAEAMDKDNFTYSYSTANGDTLANTHEIINQEVKIIALPGGGSVWKDTSTYFTNSEAEYTEKKIEAMKRKAIYLYRAALDYAKANLED